MKDNWFENKMNERFDEFDSDLDLHAAWADLEQKRKPKKKHRRNPIFWWTGAALAAIALVFVFFFSQKKAVQIDKNITVQSEMFHAENISPSSVEIKEAVIPSKNNLVEEKGKILNQENYTRKKTLEKLNLNIEKYKSEDSFLPQNPSDNNNQQTKSLPEETRLNPAHPPIQLIAPLTNKDIANLGSGKYTGYLISCDFKPAKYQYNAFGLTIRYGKAFRDTPIGRGLNSSYFQRRDLVETPLDAWSTDLFYQRKNRKNWFAQVNLGYSQTTDLFEDNYYTINSKIVEDQIVQINRYPDGSSEEITGDVLSTVEETISAKFYQSYRQAYIGLSIGKEKHLRSKLNLRLSVGAEYSLFQKNTGKVYADDNSIGTYTELNDRTRSKRGIFAANMNLEIGKLFKDHNEISFGITGKTNLTLLDTDFARRHYLLGSLSYKRYF